MRDKEFIDLNRAYLQICEQQKVGVPVGNKSDAEALKGLIPKGEKVHEVPRKTTLQKAHYEMEGDVLEAKNYGDPVADKWNRDLARFNARPRGSGEMTPPSIPRGYSYNRQAGTITRGGTNPQAPTARTSPAPARPRQSFQSTGGYGRYPVPVTPDSKRDPEFRRGPGAGVGDTRSSRPAPAARPAARPAPAARPSATTPASRPAAATTPASRPVATTPAARPVATTPAARPASTGPSLPPVAPSASPSSQLSDLQKMRLASQMRQKGANVVGTQLASFDPFDIVMGHLLDEGFAETEEAAIAIMTNMSEEWKQSIMEGPGGMMMGAASRGKGQVVKTQPTQVSQPRPNMGPNPVKRVSGIR